MTLLAATGPLILVIVLSAAFRVPVFIASWCGAGLAALIALVVPAFTAQPSQLALGLGAAGLITLQAAFVIIPGLCLNEVLTLNKAHERLVGWVHQIPATPSRKAILIVVGLAPALESMTGFGISLLVTIPPSTYGIRFQAESVAPVTAEHEYHALGYSGAGHDGWRPA